MGNNEKLLAVKGITKEFHIGGLLTGTTLTAVNDAHFDLESGSMGMGGTSAESSARPFRSKRRNRKNPVVDLRHASAGHSGRARHLPNLWNESGTSKGNPRAISRRFLEKKENQVLGSSDGSQLYLG